MGGSNFELLAPHEGESIYVGHLEANGEGFHHTCVAYPSREAMREAKAELVRQGREMVQSADMGELGEFCYFDIPELGALLELLYVTELHRPRRRSARSGPAAPGQNLAMGSGAVLTYTLPEADIYQVVLTETSTASRAVAPGPVLPWHRTADHRGALATPPAGPATSR